MDKQLDNVRTFTYPDSKFRADGDHTIYVEARIILATQTSGKMRNIWEFNSIPLKLKIRLYKLAV